MTIPPDFQGQALQFRVAMDQPIAAPTRERLALQQHLISEEYEEFIEAHCQHSAHPKLRSIEMAALKELADLVYVCFQYAVLAGWELDEALSRVHRSNMSKLVKGQPVKNEMGKVVKGPNYEPPYLEDLI
mgnify:CR=1 FL=1